MCHPCRRVEPQRKSYGDPRRCALPGCDAIYAPTHKAQRFCSVPCANKSGRGITTGSKMPRPCEICGSTYRPTYPWQRTCGRACGVELRRREHGTAGRERKHWPFTRVYIRECIWCDKLFVGRAVNSRVCSRTCGRKVNWAETTAKRRVAEHTCPCGATIQPHRNKCDACLRETKRQRRHKERTRKRESVAAEPYTLADIAARDRYRCGICIAEGRSRQASVAMTETVPHPNAPTIDHIVPWSISKDDTRANVQLAHFICNSRKHVRGSQQLALFG